ncbi:MAG TPA: sigma 54-interacting transcriptional regulator, partial [Candidatus Sulfomarinibacteraceae bacterium]|nr:sigma 54-interacting transcriptional regulator [Candidatus Sulfomarinibacteraceae bacterium]
MTPEPSGPDADILDSVADGVFTVDTEWRITSFNRAAERITGLSREAVLGRRCSEVFAASICDSGCGLRRAMTNGRSVLMRAIYIRNLAGERLPVCVSASVLRDRDGNVIGGVETFRDLSLIESVRQDVPESCVGLPGIVGHSPAMQRIAALVPIVAESDSTVLIEGESGTGKELVARALHELSGRRRHPLVTVNCGAIPDTLLESELFGYRAGAFTDARRDKAGRFELADRGSLFLDEIGEVSPALQVRLLRVLEERVVEPLGGTAAVPVDVRIIAATNRRLTELMEAGSFRHDLYYRLNVVRIHLPPLRERREDIPLLVDAMLADLNRNRETPLDAVAPDTMRILVEHRFPGNVRELRNILEHASIMCREGVVLPEHLPEELGGRPPTTGSTDPVEL